MDKDIFKPSLKEDGIRKTDTYDIRKLFYVAFFGGTIPITILGVRNSRWLGVKKGFVTAFYLIGALILVSKIFVVALYMGDALEISSRNIRLGVRVADVLLYAFMYMVMNPKYKMHLMTGGEEQPLFKNALKWIIIGIVAELALLSAGGFIGAGLLK